MNHIHYHFIGNPRSGDDLQELRMMQWDEGIIMCARHAWVWPLYCRLRNKGWEVSFGYDLEPNAVNVIHGQMARENLSALEIMKNFIVAIRADFRPFPFGDFEVVQNQLTAGGDRRIYMPHFPQPGLIARSPERTSVENVCFSGEIQNCFFSSRFESDLKSLGCRFSSRAYGTWNDMSDVDILLGIRSFRKRTHRSKPPTKLFNAWLSNIPFIGGYDSAYEQVGIPGENYIRVDSYDELMKEIHRLKNDSEYYARWVDAGAEAGRTYTPECTTERWESFLSGTVAQEFEQWKSNSKGPGIQRRIKAGHFAVKHFQRSRAK